MEAPHTDIADALHFATGLARQFCHRRNVAEHLFDTYEAEAALSLAKCLRDFDPARGVPFRAWLVMSVRRDLQDLHRMERRPRRSGELPDPPTSFDPIPALEARDALRKLPRAEAVAVFSVVVCAERACDVARQLGIHKSWLSRRLARSLGAMREQLSAN